MGLYDEIRRRTPEPVRKAFRAARARWTAPHPRAASEIGLEYGSAWAKTQARVERLIGSGERSLPRVLALLQKETDARKDAFMADAYRRFGPTFDGRPVRAELLDPERMRTLFRSVIADRLVELAGEDTERILELGSGWGQNLFNIWLRGGPRDAEYVALELTPEGRSCAQTLARLEPALRLLTAPFDFHRPDLSALGSEKRTLLFTSHSIEQLTVCPPDLFEVLLRVPGLRVGVHFEPIGWQMGRLGRRGDLDRRCRDYARTCRYNQDFYALLRGAERRGLIEVLSVQRDLLGTNPLNPTSVVVWRRRS